MKAGLFKSLSLASVFEETKIELAKEIAKTDIAPSSSTLVRRGHF